MDICVFCSANDRIAPEYFEQARQLGRWIGTQGHTLVYGGVGMGLMQCVAEAVHGAGGLVVGVVPTIVEKGGRESAFNDVRLLCDNLSDRKQLMISRSQAIIALPGGVGTLDEIFTVLAGASIGYHHKRVILYNVGGFWDSLLALLSDLEQRGMIRPGFSSTLCVAATLDEVARLVSGASPEPLAE